MSLQGGQWFNLGLVLVCAVLSAFEIYLLLWSPGTKHLRECPVHLQIHRYNAGFTLLVFIKTLLFTVGDSFLLLNWIQFLVSLCVILGLILSLACLLSFECYVAFCMTEDKIQLASELVNRGRFVSITEDGRKKQPRDVILDHLKTLTSSMQVKVLISFMFSIFVTLPVLIFTLTYRPQQKMYLRKMDFVDNVSLAFDAFFILLSVTITTAPIVFIHLRMKKRHSEVSVRQILLRIGVFEVTSSVAFLIIYSTPLRILSIRMFNFKPFAIFSLHLIIYLVFNIISLSRSDDAPVRKPVFPDQGKSSREPSAELTMTSVLQDDDGFRIMLKAARQDFAVENVLFFGAVCQWKESTHSLPSEDLLKDAVKIYELFCAVGAAAELNLSSSVREALKKQYDERNFPAEVFDDAMVEVFDLLEAQTFRRVRKSAGMQEYVNRKKTALGKFL